MCRDVDPGKGRERGECTERRTFTLVSIQHSSVCNEGSVLFVFFSTYFQRGKYILGFHPSSLVSLI